MRPAVFLDRDGTLNENPPRGDFVRRPEDLRLLKGVPRALRSLREAGYLLVVASNQSGISKGLMSSEAVAAVNARLGELLAPEGVSLDGIYVCPHSSEALCDCRKPKPGLLLRAARELGIDLARSWMVGDSARDVAAARAAGVRAMFVYGNSYDGEREAAEALSPEAVVPDVEAAARFILSAAGGGPQP